MSTSAYRQSDISVFSVYQRIKIRYGFKIIAAVTVATILQGCSTVNRVNAPLVPDPDAYTAAKLHSIFLRADVGRAAGETRPTAEEVSSFLMGTPYKANTLIGSATVPEQLVVDLRSVDCFTFIDNVEALRSSYNYEDYVKQLVKVRYKQGNVDFSHRRNFFSDWAERHDGRVRDVTGLLGAATRTVEKDLNVKSDGALFIPGLPGKEREVTYIPGSEIDSDILSHLQSGDYIGVCSDVPGLDVSHVRVFLDAAQGPVFRNASSHAMNEKVVDYPFMDFIGRVPGVVVFRPI